MRFVLLGILAICATCVISSLTRSIVDLIGERQVKPREHDKRVNGSTVKDGFLVSAGSGENVLTSFYRAAAASLGVELSAFELEFTKKVLGVKIDGAAEGKGKLQGSEKMEEEDRQAHEDVMKMMAGGGGGEEGCNCVVS